MQRAVNYIARMDTRSNDREPTGAETLEGLALPFHVLRAVHGKAEARADRDSEAPVGPGIRGRAYEARERRPGEGPAKAIAGIP
jgi:GR25 family glycosyltransferase involved in LPS biosynthesis